MSRHGIVPGVGDVIVCDALGDLDVLRITFDITTYEVALLAVVHNGESQAIWIGPDEAKQLRDALEPLANKATPNTEENL